MPSGQAGRKIVVRQPIWHEQSFDHHLAGREGDFPMHPPSDPPRTLLFKLEYEELLREAERQRLADQVAEPGLLSRLGAAIAPRLHLMRSSIALARLGWRSPPATRQPAVEV
jgi:hypothetical protein